MRLYGGFAGFETSVEGRAGRVEATLLSGDLLGDDTDDPATWGDNSRHVVRVDGTGRLDGVTVMAGYANVGGIDDGGGVLILGGHPVIVGCHFVRNRAEGDGGALFSGPVNFASDSD